MLPWTAANLRWWPAHRPRRNACPTCLACRPVAAHQRHRATAIDFQRTDRQSAPIVRASRRPRCPLPPHQSINRLSTACDVRSRESLDLRPFAPGNLPGTNAAPCSAETGAAGACAQAKSGSTARSRQARAGMTVQPGQRSVVVGTQGFQPGLISVPRTRHSAHQAKLDRLSTPVRPQGTRKGCGCQQSAD